MTDLPDPSELNTAGTSLGEPLAREVVDAATQVGEDLKQPLADAAEAVKGTAADAAQQVKPEPSSSEGVVTHEAKHASGGAGTV